MRTLFRPILILISLCVVTFSTAQAQLLRDAEIEQFLADYAHPLFEAAGIDPNSVEIHLLGDPTPNAFVGGGLHMYIHTGLITLADTPNQIQGVIAHETGHLAGGHQQRGSEAIALATRPMMLSLVLGTVAALAGEPNMGVGIMQLGQQIGTGSFLSYSRGQESAADQAGLSYLEEVGASGAGVIEFFGKLRNRQLIREYQINPYYQTHPMANSRMTALRNRAENSEFWDKKDSPEAIEKLHLIQAKINGFMQPPHVTLRQYPLKDKSDSARYARAVAYYRGAELEKGLKEINYLIETYPDNPFYLELKGQMLFEHGKAQEAIAPHRKSTELAPQYALLEVNLARALAATEQPDNALEAIKVLKSALNKEPNNSFGWTELARVYSQLGDDTKAALATAEAYYAIGNLPEAHRFATRAAQSLPQDTPEWRQANDIIQASLDAALKARRSPQHPRRK
ncbi:MAG: M48 family metalloprotease [bacterium]